MKTTEELIQEIESDLINPKINCKSLSLYYLKASGDIKKDFYNFTHVQGGGLSRDLTDPYLKNGGTFPPEKWVDGYKYHTSGDITWQTARYFFPQITSQQFYSMGTNSEGGFAIRMKIVEGFLKGTNLTSSDAVNMLLAHCKWASGNFMREIRTYNSWYKSNIKADVLSLGAKTVFARLIVIRKYTLRQIKAEPKNPGWIKGVLCFYKLFSTYL